MYLILFRPSISHLKVTYQTKLNFSFSRGLRLGYTAIVYVRNQISASSLGGFAEKMNGLKSKMYLLRHLVATFYGNELLVDLDESFVVGWRRFWFVEREGPKLLQTLLITSSVVHFATFGFFERCFPGRRGPQATRGTQYRGPAAGGRTVRIGLGFGRPLLFVTNSQTHNKTGKKHSCLSI